MVNRLHNGQTASTRARAARGQPTVASGHPRDGATGHRDLMTSSFRGKLPEPPPPTAAVKVKQNESSQVGIRWIIRYGVPLIVFRLSKQQIDEILCT